MTNETPTGPEVQSQGATDRPGGNPSNPEDPSRVRVGFPSGAVEQLRNHGWQVDADGAGIGVSRQALDEVLAWIDRYVPTSRPDMELSLGNDVGELVIEDPDLEVELIRFNGRTFVPETPTIVEDDTFNAALAEAHEVEAGVGRTLLYLARRHAAPATVLGLVRRELADPGCLDREAEGAVRGL